MMISCSLSKKKKEIKYLEIFNLICIERINSIIKIL